VTSFTWFYVTHIASLRVRHSYDVKSRSRKEYLMPTDNILVDE